MSGPSSSGTNTPVLEQELYFLIVKFLEAGPCQRAAEALREELQENKLLPTRTDWTGQKHFRSYEELVEINKHIKNDHLLEICKRIGPLLEKDVKASVSGVSTLLGAGRQSVLRTLEEYGNVATSKWKGETYAACRRSRALFPPHNLAQPVNINYPLRARSLCGTQNKDVILSPRLYSKIGVLSRSLGHLSAVYCVAFDRTGKIFITGADDHLVKIWSAVSGRLLVTLRGCGAEITDLAVNYENTVIAAGSCDKQIRLWCLKTAIPLAVLHGHSGMITSLQFCPFVRGDTRYLMSTGGDGCVCFWTWNATTRKFQPKPIKFIERSRAGAQMLCSSFSPGGVFLATGNSDHVLRVYCFTSSQPEKICELESHSDRVDSIQYASRSDRFVSGSKDGTAKIWRYERQEWRAITLNMSTQLPGATSPSEEAKQTKYRVTMVGWSQDDQYVLTAVSDSSLKVWNSHTGQLIHVLKGHEDEVFVLEHNPVDHRILVSAGHDGYIIIWDIKSGTMIKRFFNTIEGQGHGAVFDCKWSPDGQMFAATDSHGFSLLFGFGSNERFKKLPEEMFFHTDYRPLIRDANNFVLDEQTQQPPHLMPPPFLVDIDGNPQPPHLQRIVPGREHLTDHNQLIPQLGVTPSGDREVLDHAVAEFMQPEIEPIDLPPPPPPPPPAPVEDEPQPGRAAADHRPSLDEMIQIMQREQDQRVPPHRRPSTSDREVPNSPPPMRGPRRSGEMEGVRQATGHVPISQLATGQDLAACMRRVIARKLGRALYRSTQEFHQAMSDIEIKKFVWERKKKPPTTSKRTAADSSDDEGPSVRTRKTKKRPNNRSQGSSRSTRNEETGRNRLTTLALYDTDYEEEEEEETAPVESEETVRPTRQRDEERDEDTEEEDMWSSSSSDGESSEYSDWTQDTGINLQPPKRSQRQPKRRKMTSTEEETDDPQEEEVTRRPTTSGPSKRRSERKKHMSRERKQRQQRKIIQHATENIQELPDEFKPPDWLTNTIPRKVPYVPQMGDEVIYFRQGHELYLHAVKRRKVYDVNPNKNQPWHKMPNLREQELVKVVGIKYEIRPPRLVCLKLAFIDSETCRMTGGSFTIKYHDMPDVIDFLVLKQPFDVSRQRNWKAGDQFRSMIDDAWWTGVIETQEPLSIEFPDSLFQCFNVRWDNGEKEKMSPWDLEPYGDDDEPDEVGGSRPVSPEELRSLMYTPKEGEWPDHGRDVECDRILRGLESIMTLSIAEPFLAPVDLNAFPAYAMVIEYMVDLTMIKSRLENRFYRRVNSVQYDVRYIESNTARFNEARSMIVKQAKLVTELIMRFIGNTDCLDPMPIYTELTRDSDFAVLPRDNAENDHVDIESDSDDVDDGGEGTSSRMSRSKKGGKKKQSRRNIEPNAWKLQCRQLLDIIVDCDDSIPFRYPVDPDEYPDYYRIVDNPVDLSSVREQLSCDAYESPLAFCKDLRLIFHNSKMYNTNKRSRIYAMTLRLSAMFDEQINDIINDWKSAKKFQKTGGLPPSLRSQSSAGTSSAAASVAGASTARVQPTGSQSRRSSGAAAPSRRTARIISEERRAQLSAAAASQPRQIDGQFVPKRNERHRSGQARHQAQPGGSQATPQTTRYGRTVKRKRQLTDSSENTELGLEESESSEFDFEGEVDKKQKRKIQKAKKSRRSQRKPVKRELQNGHNRYGTRYKTGAIKRRRYESDDETEVEEEEDNKRNNGEDSGSDTEDNTAQKSKDSDEESSSSSNSSSSSSSSSDSATEIEGGGNEGSDDNDNDDNDDDNDDKDGHVEAEEDDEVDEDEDDIDVRRSRRMATQHSTRASRSSNLQRRSGASSSNSSFSRTPPEQEERRGGRRRTTRNQGKRTVTYREESDNERQGNVDPDSEDSDSGAPVSVSSRGRVRRLTPRARAVLMGDS